MASERDLAQRGKLGFVTSSGFHGPHGEAQLQNVMHIALVTFPFPWTPVHSMHWNGDILATPVKWLRIKSGQSGKQLPKLHILAHVGSRLLLFRLER